MACFGASQNTCFVCFLCVFGHFCGSHKGIAPFSPEAHELDMGSQVFGLRGIGTIAPGGLQQSCAKDLTIFGKNTFKKTLFSNKAPLRRLLCLFSLPFCCLLHPSAGQVSGFSLFLLKTLDWYLDVLGKTS